MLLIKEGKTNIKYLFIVTIIAIFAGGIMLGAFELMKCPYWWSSVQTIQLPKDETAGCKNLCGDGVCQEIVCMAIGCPCAETKENCSQDCKDETADWQTYRNKEYGFEVKYPEDLVINPPEIASLYEPEGDLNFFDLSGYNTLPVEVKEKLIAYDLQGSLVMSISYYSNVSKYFSGFDCFSDIKTIDEWKKTVNLDWLRNQKCETFLIPIFEEGTLIDGQKAYKYFMYNHDGSYSSNGVIVGKDDYLYVISFNNNSSSENFNQDNFNQMLSTFRFIDQVSSSAAIFCTDSLACPVKMKCDNKKCVDVRCAAEGQNLPGIDYDPEYLSHLPSECCQGLNKISYSGYFDENCNDIPLEIAPSGTCTKCGNGICETWETKCNCPKDCQGSETYKSEKYGFEFKYPKDLIDLGQEPFEAYLKIPDPNFTVIKLLQIKTPDPDRYNYDVPIEGAIQFTVATSSDIVSSCLETETEGEVYNISSETINGIKFARYDYDDVGLGNRLSERVFSTILNNICYRVEIIISGYGFNIGPELTREKAEEDEVQYELPFSVYDVIDKLTPILSTFRFLE